jgi:serine/threonine protein kinase KIN1/2
MLVTDPKQRASMSEIMNHPWMTKGFNTAPENFLPHREPLQLPLEPDIVEKMSGFDFGPPEYINAQLTKVLESEDYQSAVRLLARDQAGQTQSNEKRRGVFDFYKRRNSTTSRDTLSNPSNDALQLGSDPLNAFSPLISIYYLAREKRDRERVEANPGALALPTSPAEKPLKMPDLAPPEAAHTNEHAYEIPGEKTTGGRSRPRARTQGEDDVADGMKKVSLGKEPGPTSPALLSPSQDQPIKKESTAAGILRRLSTRRPKDRGGDRDRDVDLGRERTRDQPPPSLQVQPPEDLAAPPRKSFSVRRTRHREPSPSTHHQGGSQPQHQDLLSPEPVTKAGKILGRSTSVNSGEYRRRQAGRRGVSEGIAAFERTEPPQTSGSDRSSVGGPQKLTGGESTPTDTKAPTAPRSATTTSRTKSLGHARRESIQARRQRRVEEREANVPEETDAEMAATADHNNAASPDMSKPVYLKGLFSVSTTSNKPLPVIRADIIRVLKQLGVEYTEIKGGFSCCHAPSIDLNTVVDNGPPSPDRQGPQGQHRRKISFGGFRGSAGNDRDEFRSSNRRPGGPDRSFTTNSEDSADDVNRDGRDRNSGEGVPAGETTTHVQSDLGGSLVVKFEIFIVKVPLFALHGIQFKKVAGGTWDYKNLASKILEALRL